MPWDQERLPVDVDDWLMPVMMCLTRIQNEANKAASKPPSHLPGGSQYHDS